MRGSWRIAAGALLAVGVLAGRAAAATPVGAEFLLVRDAQQPRGGKLRFEALLSPAPLADPRVDGATFEVVGDGDGEGGSGIVALHASRWTGLGTPAGSAGYRYLDRTARDGVRVAILRREGGAMRLRIAGSGPATPFRVARAHGAIDVRFAIGRRTGDDAWCARLSALADPGPGRIVGRDAVAPANCSARHPRCGNRVVEGVEECDDGNGAAGDGCAPGCVLEDPSGVCAGVPRSPHDRVRLVEVASGLPMVTHVAAPPLDPRRLFVVRQGGEIRVIRDGVLLPAPFLALDDSQLAAGGERGLLSVAFHADFEANRRFFIYYTAANGDLVIARYEASADPDRADPSTRRVLLRVRHPRSNHNGGQLVFGPDGYLWAGLGDGGGGGDPAERGQDPHHVLGKILRIDADVEAAPHWAVPATNPDPRSGRNGLIWSLGWRNPWRFSFDRLTGDLYVGDVGQNQREEIDFEPAGTPGGRNYGWDVFEGTSCHDPAPHFTECPQPSPFVDPVLEYPHGGNAAAPEGCSVTGGFVYRGCAVEGLQGHYFFADFCTRFVRTLRIAGGAATDHRDRSAEIAPAGAPLGNPTTFGEDARGELYVGDLAGRVFALRPAD